MDYSDPFFLLTIAVAAFIIAAAYLKGKIDVSAVFASGLVGFLVIFTLLDYWFYIYVILAFFAFGNFITKYRHSVKEEYRVAEGMRTAKNVFGNGGAAVIFSLVFFATQDPVFLLGVVGSMATATADTFATEVGQAHERNPRLITNLLKKVSVGCSGAVSRYGVMAALVGAAAISLIPVLLGSPSSVFVVGTVAGFLGCVVDSFIGATVERRFLDTHLTNFLATSFGGLLAIGLANSLAIFI